MLSAQGGTVPPGYETIDPGGSLSYQWDLGRYPQMRAQISNGDLRGKGPVAMKEISFRRAMRVGTNMSVARNWSRVRLQLGGTDLGKLTATFSTNFSSTPVTVFDQAHDWPALSLLAQYQASGAYPWNHGGLRFPFATSYVYPGTQDLLLDMSFQGGTLPNGGTWPSGSGAFAGLYYPLSAQTWFDSGTEMATAGLDAHRHPCARDSASSAATGPGSFFWVYSYPANTGDPRQSNWIQVQQSLAEFPPKAIIYQAVTLAGTLDLQDPRYPAIPGLGCQPLMVDLQAAVELLMYRADDLGGAGRMLSRKVPFQSAFVGIRVYSQALWQDSVTQAFKLSRSSRATIMPQPVKSGYGGRFSSSISSLTRGSTPVPSGVPIYRYR